MSNQIESLTKEQEALIPIYRERYLQIGLSTTPTNRTKAEDAITRSYKYLKLAPPRFIWADSPFAGIKIAAQLANGVENPTKEQISEQAGKASYGSFESYWVSTYAFIAEVLPVKKDELIDIVKDIVMDCGVYWTFEDVVVVTEKPTNISMVDKKLHNTERKALEYKDSTGLWVINGQVYPSLLEARLAEKLGDKSA